MLSDSCKKTADQYEKKVGGVKKEKAQRGFRIEKVIKKKREQAICKMERI